MMGSKFFIWSTTLQKLQFSWGGWQGKTQNPTASQHELRIIRMVNVSEVCKKTGPETSSLFKTTCFKRAEVLKTQPYCVSSAARFAFIHNWSLVVSLTGTTTTEELKKSFVFKQSNEKLIVLLFLRMTRIKIHLWCTILIQFSSASTGVSKRATTSVTHLLLQT